MATSFIHLHCHSNYSLLDSTVRLENLVAMAKSMNMSAVAVTDTNNLSGSVTFYELAEKTGIKPIIGAEIVLEDETSIVLLVKDKTGYFNLCEIITHGKLKGGHLKFQMSPHFVTEHSEGLICLSGGKTSNIYRHLKRRNRRQAFHNTLLWKEAFKKDFYLEIQSFHPQDDFSVIYLSDLSKALQIKTVATNDVHMLQPQEFEIWQVLRAINENTLVNNIENFGSPDQYFKNPLQMSKRFRSNPEALINTLEIAKKCNFQFSLGKPIFPEIDLNPGETALQKLRKLCEIGLRKRYSAVTSEAKERLEREIDTIVNLGFVEYFLIVKDIVEFCNKENIPCVGRGSAADSIVSYVLGITRVDPIRYELYFERFLNPERTDAPDIDLDICWKNRERVLQYVYQKYSHDKTALIATFVTFQMRSSIREISKTMGLPEDEIKRLTKYLPHRGIEEFQHAITNVPECSYLIHQTGLIKVPHKNNGQKTLTKNNLSKRETVLEKIIRIAQFISDFPRHLSVHPGGTIIAPDKITNFTPLEVAGGGLIISQHNMYSIEKLGLVKMDLLGVRSLSIITDTVKLIEENRHVKLDINSITEDDSGTIEFIKEANTIGCFQLESPGMRGLIRKMQIENLDDVIAAISLIRPGPAEGGMKDLYVERRAGLKETTYLHPNLEPVLKSTYGIILYQEQVLLVAQAIAGFTLGEADILRRGITKARNDKTIKPMHQRFIDGAEQKGIEKETAEKVWEWLTHFIGYGFNKAHSSTYGLLSYQTAYLKKYFPLEYMTSVLNNDGGFYPRFAYIEESRKKGIKILPPDVMQSEILYTIENGALRVGLGRVFELRESTIKKIISERNRKDFYDIYDLILRTDMNRREAEHLARCGALSFFENSETNNLMRIRLFFKNHKRKYLAEAFSKDLNLEAYPKYQKILNELELLRFSVTAHPLTLFLENNPGIEFTPSKELDKLKDQHVTVVGWVIMSRRLSTAKNEYMKFITIEDLWGTIEVVLFPNVYKQIGRETELSGPLQIIGQIQSRVPGEVNLIAEKVIPLQLFPKQKSIPKTLPEYAMTG